MSYKDWLFRNIHTKKLIYNCCWEDPACDRALLNLNAESDIFMITSAGCNALDYLLDNPRSIQCVDLNYRQNAVLDLKISLFKHGDYDLLWQFFGEGKHDQAKEVYNTCLRSYLKPTSQKYWDKNIGYFNGSGLRNSFYYRGSSGFLAWLTKTGLQLNRHRSKKIRALFDVSDMTQQKRAFKSVSHSISNAWWAKFFNHSSVLSLAGVPETQARLVNKTNQQGPLNYVQDCLSEVFSEVPSGENYFYYVYWTGKYQKNNAPNYLKEENFKLIQDRVDRIQWDTISISEALERNQKGYSHYVLLDHMDWLASHDTPELEREWRLIQALSPPGTTVLLRSAAPDLSFLPEIVKTHFHPEDEKIDPVKRKDRVGMYQTTGLFRKN